MEEETERLQEPEDQDTLPDTVPNMTKKLHHDISTIWLLKLDLNNDNTS